MDTISTTATIYGWDFEGKPFDVDYLVGILGGRKSATEKEILKQSALRTHSETMPLFHYTDDLVIYQRGIVSGSSYSTPRLAERMGEVGLELPEHELIFANRTPNDITGIDLVKIAGIGCHLIQGMRAKDVLAVRGTDIENGVLYASPGIEGNVSGSVLSQ